jgi:hypothetical protein
MKVLIVAAALGALLATPGLAAPAGQTRTVKTIVQANGDKVEADSEAARIVADCSARKFETTAELQKDGERRLTKLKLCSAEGEDEAGWVRTLEDAKAKIAANDVISAESKVKIVAELEAEIAKIHAGAGH